MVNKAITTSVEEKLGEIPIEVANAVNPVVWASDIPGKSKLAESVSIALKPGATPERVNMALGILPQRLRNQQRIVAYFSKQLDNVSQGWPGCLKAVAATILLIQEA
ncbi:hypothetical protein HGM15179_019050 [Zosterops borbonicus]|uniref:Uncharacterized protein n=1 Tax=Zosterops borbonicus TaxID=364589 RepID=A0A8K1DAL8_9PASS|nr:hypothetical protein HGM15179_019050 [Zosterops borbonicus]